MADWGQVIEIVEAFAAAEGAPKRDALYRALANGGIGKISTRVGHFETHWNNDSDGGTLTLSGRYVTFPADLIDVTSAYWNEVKLDEAPSEGWLDDYDSLWRTTDGVPTIFLRTGVGMTLNRAPTGSTDGYLVVYGTGCIPLFADGTEADPFDYIPDPHGLLLADYIIGHLPPRSYRELAEVEPPELRLLLARQWEQARQEANQRWAEGLDLCVADILKRKLPAQTGS